VVEWKDLEETHAGDSKEEELVDREKWLVEKEQQLAKRQL
jgi:hypothetical protein